VVLYENTLGPLGVKIAQNCQRGITEFSIDFECYDLTNGEE
jgi:hypothetical protein